MIKNIYLTTSYLSGIDSEGLILNATASVSLKTEQEDIAPPRILLNQEVVCENLIIIMNELLLSFGIFLEWVKPCVKHCSDKGGTCSKRAETELFLLVQWFAE